MTTLCFWMILSVVSLATVHGWGLPPPAQSSRRSVVSFMSNRNDVTTSVTTIDLGGNNNGNNNNNNENYEETGKQLAESIARWLDAEWIPQEVHMRMGESAKMSYVTCRRQGQNDLMDVMMKISLDLDENWDQYNDDAFVNAYDVGNYAADWLTKKLTDNEGCECTSELF